VLFGCPPPDGPTASLLVSRAVLLCRAASAAAAASRAFESASACGDRIREKR